VHFTSAMSSTALRKCLCCKDMFHPDARNRRHQQFCAKDACRKASKAARQAAGCQAGEPGLLPRQRQLRAGPAVAAGQSGYSRARPLPARLRLQDVLNRNPLKMSPCAVLHALPLQDDLLWQPALIVGLIAVMTVMTCRRHRHHRPVYINRGRDILRMVPGV